jgi:transposase
MPTWYYEFCGGLMPTSTFGLKYLRPIDHTLRSEPVRSTGRRTSFSFRSGLGYGDSRSLEVPKMSLKSRTHARGERGQAFADQIRDLPLNQLLCVSLDISKYFHVAMIHNGLGEIITPPFEISIFQSGFDQLCCAVDEARQRTQAQVVWVGLEPTSHYFENLARHLLTRPQAVKLINGYAVKENRNQQMMRCEKTDQIDAAAIGDLLRRGEGTPFQPATGPYLQLQHLDRVRLSKVKLQTMLKNQIIGHLDRLFPGLVLIGEEARRRYTPLFATDLWECQTLQHLIRVCPDPRQLAALSPTDLVTAFHQQHYALGTAKAAKIIAYAQTVLLPDPELVAIRSELLQHDLALLAEVEHHLAELEDRIRAVLALTPYRLWAKLKGLTEIQAASLAAAIGDPSHYQQASQIFRRAGLVSGRNDSGTRQRKGKGKRILKTGDVYLRRALMNAVESLRLHQPVLHAYYHHLKQTKADGVARVATARRTIGILWATLRDQQPQLLIFKREATM